MGTGPFTFDEHVAGSHWRGRKFKDYFEKGKPYLDGFLAIFIARRADGERARRGRGAGRVPRPFARRPRPHREDARRQGGGAGDRRGCARSSSRSTRRRSRSTTRACAARCRSRSTAGAARRRCRRSRWCATSAACCGRATTSRRREKELLSAIRASRRTSTLRARRRGSSCRKPGVPNLTFTLTNRNVAMPYTPVGVFLIDQWRQIGVNVKHEQLETKLYLAAQQRDNPTFDAALDFNCDFMDEPNLQLAEVPLARPLVDQLRAADRPHARRALRQAVGRARQEEALRDPARVREARARAGVHDPDDLVAPHHRARTSSSRAGTSRRATTSGRTWPTCGSSSEDVTTRRVRALAERSPSARLVLACSATSSTACCS